MPVYDDIAKFFGRSNVCYNPTWLGAGPGAWDEEYWFAEAQPWKDAKQRRWVPWRDLVDSRRTMMRRATDYSGVLYEADTLDEVWPRQRPFGPYPWVEPDVYPGDDRATDYWDKIPP